MAAIFHRDRESGGGTWEDGDQAAIEAALPRASQGLDVFEQFIADNGTVLGHFTIADFAAGPVIWRTRRLPLDLERWPKSCAFATRSRRTPPSRPPSPSARGSP